jgi:hypothetical protein
LWHLANRLPDFLLGERSVQGRQVWRTCQLKSRMRGCGSAMTLSKWS